MRAVRKHVSEKWVLLYIERWLRAPAEDEQSNRTARVKGTPQGGVISPLLANLFLHYALDQWMAKQHPAAPFERYADDAIVHCRTRVEAERLREALGERLRACGLELNLQKTKVVYCKDANRREEHETQSFTFLGFEFRPRSARNRHGVTFVSHGPAISPKATQRIRDEVRTWQLHQRSDKSLHEMAEWCNPKIRGWVQYYGKYSRKRLVYVFRPLQYALIRWACRKYRKLRHHRVRAAQWLHQLAQREPQLWAHWSLGAKESIP